MKKDPRVATIARYALMVGIGLLLFDTIVNHLDSVGVFIHKVFAVLSPILIGAFVAYLIHKPVGLLEKWFEKARPTKGLRFGVRRVLAMIISYVAVLAFVVALMYVVLPEVVKSLGVLVTRIQPAANNLANWLASLLEQINVPQETIGKIFESWQSVVATLLTSIGNLASWVYSLTISFMTGTFNVALGLLISVYLVYGREGFARQAKKLLYAFCSLERADIVVSVVRRSAQLFSIFLYVRLLCSIMVAVVIYGVLAPFGVNYIVLIAVISGVTNIVPIFGPIVGTVLCCLLLVIISPSQIIGYLVVSLIVQQIEGNVIEPKMMGQRMGLPAFWVLFAVLVGGGFFGVPGMIFGVPVLAIVYSLITAVVESRLVKRNIDLAT